ncbi:DUF1033 family protein [Vagococcus fluvialis]|uniref:DUF1033 family protein n=1 Tax=Vagococcus fluvialis TaxID=2738 RepID=UPI001D0B0BF9|nr:DUF1033 family protein [Vagococcus fluvialis]UDM70194.1 DUF1033 family protein [Vagococcus fluvialis]UDM73456.1 DUF1033 family protein [Vagococcus fluvialis]UDM77613.1 DUF1033 family protein [Vagococcus fluvialis]UDM81883.1 DUF1033 family protein [Vagococcus fluvialis]
MFQVITMYGENEPWWFFEDWQEDIIEEKTFDKFHAAKDYYDELVSKYSKEYEKMREKAPFMSAFWHEGELIYCDDCDEELQAYKGIMILKDYQKIDDGECKKDETTNYCRKAQCRAGHS